MKKCRSEGNVVELTAPMGGVTVDVPKQIGTLVVIPTITASAGDKFNGLVRGVVSGLTKPTGQAWTEGQAIYWDPVLGKMSSHAGDNHFVGYSLEVVDANGTESGEILFNGAMSQYDETT